MSEWLEKSREKRGVMGSSNAFIGIGIGILKRIGAHGSVVFLSSS